MLNVLKRALAGIAVLVLMPVEVVVRGVRTVMSVLMPQRNTGLMDAALDVVEEAPVPTQLQPTEAQLAAKRALLKPSEGQRVRLAAQAIVGNGLVEKRLLDPSMGRDAQLLEWLSVLAPQQLQILATADPVKIGRHLSGVRSLTLPTLSQGVEIRESRKALAAPALTEREWKGVLMHQAAAKESPKCNLAKLDRSARRLARMGWNLEHARQYAREHFSGEQTAV